MGAGALSIGVIPILREDRYPYRMNDRQYSVSGMSSFIQIVKYRIGRRGVPRAIIDNFVKNANVTGRLQIVDLQ